MKTLLLSFALCLAILPSSAQITITSSDMPDVGDSIHVSYALGVGSVDHTLTDTNYVWDFSSLVPIAQQEFRYEAPTALPFNFLSTVAFLNPSPDSLPFIGNIPSNFTDYIKNGSSGYRQNGFSFDYAPLTSFSIPVIYTANDYIFRFPLDYGDMDTSDAAYAINFPPLPYIGQSIHRESNVDGWGTLITPFGTFNTLRVVSYVTINDTVSLDSVTGFSSTRPLEIQYKWMADGMKVPVLEIDAQILFSTEVITTVVYQDSLRVTLPQVSVAEQNQVISTCSVYPSPAQGSCFVSFNLNGIAPVEINLIDLSGREVKNFGKETLLQGQQSKQLDLNGIAPGIYLINITSGDSKITRRIVLSN